MVRFLLEILLLFALLSLPSVHASDSEWESELDACVCPPAPAPCVYRGLFTLWQSVGASAQLENWCSASPPCGNSTISPTQPAWQGVGCSVNGDIISIKLDSVGLQGTITADWMALMPTLQTLQLSQNPLLIFYLPADLNGACPQLQQLLLYFVQIEGALLPSTFPSSLQVLRLVWPWNGFDAIPYMPTLSLTSTLWQCSELQEITIWFGNVHWQWFDSMQSVCQLQQLQIFNVGLSLPVLDFPACLSSLVHLREFHLQSAIIIVSSNLEQVLSLMSPHMTAIEFSLDAGSTTSFVGRIPTNISDMFPQLQQLILTMPLHNSIAPGTDSVPLPPFLPSSMWNLQLSNCGLQGPIPPGWSLLTRMQQFDLSRNQLQQTLPPSFFNGWTRLTQLILDGNPALIRSMPDLSSCTLLSVLQISKCIGSNVPTANVGPLPRGLDRMTKLQRVDMGCAGFSGQLNWTALAQSRALSHLSIPRNQFSGALPEENRWTKLTLLEATGTPLGGSLPENIAKNANLNNILLSNCNLTGDIPASFGSLSKLTTMDLRMNYLTGWPGVLTGDSANVWPPPSPPLFPLLQRLWLSSNHLTGMATLVHLLLSPSLQTFDLSYNNITLLALSQACPFSALDPLLLSQIAPKLVTLDLSNNLLARGDIVSAVDSLLNMIGLVFALSAAPNLTSASISAVNLALCPPLIPFLQPWNALCNESLPFSEQQPLADMFADIVQQTMLHLSSQHWVLPPSHHDLSHFGTAPAVDVQSVERKSIWQCLSFPTKIPKFTFFPRLLSVDLSHNPIGIYLRQFGLSSDLSSYRLLLSASLRNISLRGTMSDALGFIPVLLLDMNTHMRSQLNIGGKWQLPSFARQASAGSSINVPTPRLSCPDIVGVGASTVNMDAAYLYFQHCTCDVGWAWVAQLEVCIQCPQGIVCDGNVFQPVHRVRSGWFPLSEDGTPLHSADWANRTLADPLWLFDTTIVPCSNAPSACVASSDVASNGSAFADSDAFLCAEGHDSHSLQCAACLPSFYMLGTSCVQCPRWSRPVLLLLSACGLALLFLYFWHETRLLTDSPADNVKHAYAEPAMTQSSGAAFLLTVTWLQTLGVLTDVGVRAPSHWSADAVSRVSNFSPVAWECISPALDETGQFLIVGTLVLVVQFITLAVPSLMLCMRSRARAHARLPYSACASRLDHWQVTLRRVQQFGLLMLFFLYLNCARMTLMQLRWERIPIFGSFLLSSLHDSAPSSRSVIGWRTFLTWIPAAHPTAQQPGDILASAPAILAWLLVVLLLVGLPAFCLVHMYADFRSTHPSLRVRQVDSQWWHWFACSRLNTADEKEVMSERITVQLQDQPQQQHPSSKVGHPPFHRLHGDLAAPLLTVRDEAPPVGESDEFDVTVSALSVSAAPVVTRSVFAFLSVHTHVDCWYFELLVVTLLRKLSLVLLIVLLPRDELLVLLLVSLLLLASVLLSIHLHPFRRRLDNALDVLLLLHLFATFQVELIASVVTANTDADDGDSGSGGVGSAVSESSVSTHGVSAARLCLDVVQYSVLLILAINLACFHARKLYTRCCRQPAVATHSHVDETAGSM
jgi:hypothetical protein